jgi:5'-nucleotidase
MVEESDLHARVGNKVLGPGTSAEVRILVCNDDGIYSPGLAALAEVAAQFGEVRVVAPDVEQSSMSHAITGSRPLWYRKISLPHLKSFESYRVNGTPADCAALGLSQWSNIDLVLSGINLGLNVGNAVWHSGTLAAAKQAALLGVRGIAFSTPVGENETDFTVIKTWVAKALTQVLAEKEMPLLNINIPKAPKGICWARQSSRLYDGKIVNSKDPMGNPNYWFTFTPIEQVEEGTDRWAVGRHLVSITPLRLDLTDDELLRKARERHGCGEDGQLKPAAA